MELWCGRDKDIIIVPPKTHQRDVGLGVLDQWKTPRNPTQKTKMVNSSVHGKRYLFRHIAIHLRHHNRRTGRPFASPPIITIVRTLHTYDSIINDIKAKHGVIRDGLEVYGPFDTRKKTFTRVFQPTKEQHASIIQLGQDHLSNQH